MSLLLLLTVSLILPYLGFKVYDINRKNLQNIAFLLFSMINLFFIISNHLAVQTGFDIDSLFFFIKLTVFWAPFQAYTMLLFIVNFPNVTDRMSGKVGKILGILAIVIGGLIIFTDLVFSGYELTVDGGVIPIPGPLIPLFAIYSIGIIIFSIILLVKKINNSIGSERVKLIYIGIGTISSVTLLAVLNFLSTLIFSTSRFVQYTPIYMLPMVFSMTYSIIRLRVIDTKIAIRSMIVRFLASFLYSIILLVSLYAFLTNRISLSKGTLAEVLTIILLVGFFYDYIDNFFKEMFTKLMFSTEYKRKELFNDLQEKIVSSLHYEDLEANLYEGIKKLLGVDSVQLILEEDIKDGEDSVVQYVLESKTILVRDEIAARINRSSNQAHVAKLINYRKEMSDIGAGAIIPLSSKGKVAGIIIIGDKTGGEYFDNEDIEYLIAISYQIGLIIENSRLFDEVKQFNKKLQTEVATATADLKIRNKRLTILRRLDQIIMNTLEVDNMSQKIADLVSWEMGFAGALLVLLEEEPNGERYLRVGGISSEPIFERALKILPKDIKEYRLSFGDDPSNLFFRSITDRKPFATDTFRDLYVPPLSLKVAETLQNLTHSEHMVVYPLSAKGRPLGAIVFTLSRPFVQLSIDDKELLEAFMDEAGIAIENARLYEEIQKRNNELKVANKRLLQLDKMKDELVSVASHELRTPMTAIKSYIWMSLNKQRDNLTPELQKYLERAYISSDRMINLVNDMLSASRLEGGRIELDIQAHDVVPIITEIVEQLIPKAKERGLKLTFVEPKEDIPLGLIDESRYREILYNLIGNSVKYTEKGSIKVTVSAHAGGSPRDKEKGGDRKNRYLWVEVTDTGRGIDKEDLPRLFKKFSKLEQGSFTKTAESGGTGLGLYITKGLVELHGGTIWVDSKGQGKGSTFGFSVRMA